MSISITPPPAPPKKRGLGCLGCGCLVLVLLVILFVGLVGGTGYLGYTKILALTTTTPAAIPSFDGGDDLYQNVLRKLADFDQDVKNHQAATIQLSADEINTLIARNPDALKSNIHAFVTLTDNEARLQASFPTDALSRGIITGRYFSADSSFEVHFDLTTKSVNLTFHALQMGDKVLMGSNAENDRTTQTLRLQFFAIFNQAFNQQIRQNPDGAALLDQARSIEIQNGELVIETQ
jgi:hypothetical protein